MKLLLTLTLLAASLSCVGQETKDGCPIGKKRTTIQMGTSSYQVDIKDACLTDADVKYFYNEIAKSSCMETGMAFFSFDKKGYLVLEREEKHTWDDEKGCIVESYTRPHGECIFYASGCPLNEEITEYPKLIDFTYFKPITNEHALKMYKKPVKPRSYTLWYIVAGLAFIAFVIALFVVGKNRKTVEPKNKYNYASLRR